MDLAHKIWIANSIETILPDQTLQPTSFTCPNRILCRNYADISKTSWIILQLSVSLSFCISQEQTKSLIYDRHHCKQVYYTGFTAISFN